MVLETATGNPSLRKLVIGGFHVKRGQGARTKIRTNQSRDYTICVEEESSCSEKGGETRLQ